MTYLTHRLLRHRIGADATVFLNALSGAVDVFSDAEVQVIDSLAGGPPAPDAADLLRRLGDRGYVYTSADEERRAFVRLREVMHRIEQEEPTVFAVCPTYFCFFKCSYCYEGDLTAPSHHSAVGADDILEGMRQLEDFLRENLGLVDRPYVTFLGGEPLQRSCANVVLELLERGAAAGYRFVIITNGYCLDEFLTPLRQLGRALKYVQVTLDGVGEVHDARRSLRSGDGTFEVIAANVDEGLAAGLPLQIRTNVDAGNLAGLPQLGRFMRRRGWTEHRNFKAYLAPTEDSTCRGLRNVLTEDELLARWFALLEDEECHADLAVFDPAKLFGTTGMIEAAISGGDPVLPRFSYCAATKGKSFVFGPEGSIYQCLRGVGDARTSVGQYAPRFAVRLPDIERWMKRDVTATHCSESDALATLHGGGCALESLHRAGDLYACSCHSAPQVVTRYLEVRKSALLDRSKGGRA